MIISPKTEYENLSHGSQKKLDAKCDDCGIKYKIWYRNYYQSQQKRGWTGITLCKKCAVKRCNMKREGTGNGKYIDNHGYVMIKVKTGRQRTSGWDAYKKEHINVIEKSINRELTKSEVVHHIDGNKLNNNIANLDLMSGHTEHRLAHTSLQEIGYFLYQKGLLTYDKKYKKYDISNILSELIGDIDERGGFEK